MYTEYIYVVGVGASGVHCVHICSWCEQVVYTVYIYVVGVGASGVYCVHIYVVGV